MQEPNNLRVRMQTLLAMGLLQLRPWTPRTVGLLGLLASSMNCYMLFPKIVFTKSLGAADAKVMAKTA